MRRDLGLALAGLLAAALGCPPAHAQDAAPARPASSPDQMRAAPWLLSVTPYAWATSLHGTAGARGAKADVDVSFHDLLENLNGAVMLDVELRRGRFALMSDTVFANLEGDGETAEGRLKVDATVNELVQKLAGIFRVGTWQLADLAATGPLAVKVDPYAGIRYTYLDLGLKARLDLPNLGIDARRTNDGDKQWVDPIIGLRTIWTLGDRFSFIASGDIGGTSTSSDYSWEALGVVGYRFSLLGKDNADLLAGYKALHQKFTDGNDRNEFEWDITMRGPVLGLTIRL